MARNASSRTAKKIPDGYQLAYDADGNVVLVPSTPETTSTRSPFSRISEGIKEGYGAGPIQGPTPEEFAKYPIASTIAEPFSMGFNALKRVPGAIAGGLAGTAGAGTELWTGDRGAANAAENAARSAMEYFANKGMAEPGMRPSANIPRNGELFAPERGPAPQLGYRGAPVIENMFALPPGAIRGTSAERAPRLTYEEPLTQYRSQTIRPTGDRAGPPTRWQAEARSEARNPVIDEMYAPTGMHEYLSNVSTEPNPLSVLNAESKLPVSTAPRWEAERALRAAEEDRMLGEGNVAPTQQKILQRLANETEADFRARQMSALEGESGAITSGRNPPNRVARALQLTERQNSAVPPEFVGPPEMQGPRQVTPETFIGSPERQGPLAPVQQVPLIEQLHSGQISGRQYQAAIDAQRAAVSAPAAESPLARALSSAPEGAPIDPVQAAINAAKQRADAMARSHADAAAQQALIDAAAQRAGTGSGPMFPNYKPYSPPSMAVPLVGAGAIGAGALALNSGKQEVKDAIASSNEAAQQAAIDAMRGREEFNQTAPNVFNQQEAIRIASARPEFNQSWSNKMPVAQQAAETAGARSAAALAPMPPTRPAELAREQPSILSRIFSGQDYQSSGPTRGDNRLYQGEKDGRKIINWGDPESAADFFRASKAQQDWNAQSPDSPSIGAGMKRGGAANAKPGKDEAVHKALDIIQHLLMRR